MSEKSEINGMPPKEIVKRDVGKNRANVIRKRWDEWIREVSKDADTNSLSSLDDGLISTAPNQEIGKQFYHAIAQALDLNYENWWKNLSNWSVIRGGIRGGSTYFLPKITDLLSNKWLENCKGLTRDKKWYSRFGQISRMIVEEKGVMPDKWFEEIIKTQSADEDAYRARMHIIDGYRDYFGQNVGNELSFVGLNESEKPEDKQKLLTILKAIQQLEQIFGAFNEKYGMFGEDPVAQISKNNNLLYWAEQINIKGADYLKKRIKALEEKLK